MEDLSAGIKSASPALLHYFIKGRTGLLSTTTTTTNMVYKNWISLGIYKSGHISTKR